jgi:hypothetical protein
MLFWIGLGVLLIGGIMARVASKRGDEGRHRAHLHRHRHSALCAHHQYPGVDRPLRRCLLITLPPYGGFLF